MNRFPKKAGFNKLIRLVLFYTILRHLPAGATPIVGKYCRKLRYLCCKGIFLKCGKNVNIERKVNFSNGLLIEIGDESGIGINCTIPNDLKIGKYVMMGPNCLIFSRNHNFSRVDIPMIRQGYYPTKQTIIGDDCWIGMGVIFTPGRHLATGSIVGAGCILTKDFPEYSIIGGNPSKLIKNRCEANI